MGNPKAVRKVGGNGADARPLSDVITQRTLKSSVSCIGVGLHSGKPVQLTLNPAPVDAGIVFRRTDRAHDTPIPARWDRVVDTRMCTTIGDGNGVSIGTVVLIMVAVAGVGV